MALVDVRLRLSVSKRRGKKAMSFFFLKLSRRANMLRSSALEGAKSQGEREVTRNKHAWTTVTFEPWFYIYKR
jgi:hypothetical protein